MTQKGVWRLGAVAAAIALLVTAPSFAQTNGRITGVLTDPSGGSLPGASVTISGTSLQGSLTTTSDASGEFRFLSVPPGTYSVKVNLAGFKSVEQTGVIVGLDRTVHLPVKLEVATVTETVTVTGETPAIDTSSASTGVNVTADLFQRIPLQRDIYDVARIATGT